MLKVTNLFAGGDSNDQEYISETHQTSPTVATCPFDSVIIFVMVLETCFEK